MWEPEKITGDAAGKKKWESKREVTAGQAQGLCVPAFPSATSPCFNPHGPHQPSRPSSSSASCPGLSRKVVWKNPAERPPRELYRKSIRQHVWVQKEQTENISPAVQCASQRFLVGSQQHCANKKRFSTSLSSCIILVLHNIYCIFHPLHSQQPSFQQQQLIQINTLHTTCQALTKLETSLWRKWNNRQLMMFSSTVGGDRNTGERRMSIWIQLILTFPRFIGHNWWSFSCFWYLKGSVMPELCFTSFQEFNVIGMKRFSGI